MAVNHPPLGLFAQIASYPRAFWFANVMEMIERCAYYGVRMALPLYMTAAVALGGLNFTHVQKADLFSWWALVSSFLPMFTGGYADRYGYKATIGVSVAMKIGGYALMATQRDFVGFTAGCMLLAAGTGLFKPGVQGLIAHSTTSRNASVGWGVFYELVNVGAWLAGFVVLVRDTSLGWQGLFVLNTALVALNFLPLFMFKEPDVPRPPRHANAMLFVKDFFVIIGQSVWQLVRQPRLLTFCLIFSGFWITFHQLFDLMPNFIDDWVSPAGLPAWFTLKSGAVAAEQFVNMNSFTIMVCMIPVAFAASKFRALTAISFGMAVAIAGVLLGGTSQVGPMVLGGIILFTFGEMLASPRTNDYLASIAPLDRKALYLGYAQVPSGIGWYLGSKFTGRFYEEHGDKVNLARHWLETEGGMSAEAAKALPKEKVMDALAAQMHVTLPEATNKLWAMYHPQTVWYWLAAIGTASLVGMIAYAVVINRLDRNKPGELSSTVPAAAEGSVHTAA